jgi:hypothetical protein
MQEVDADEVKGFLKRFLEIWNKQRVVAQVDHKP